MITDITIKNYRAFANFELDNIARINLIVGANNAGKTSLLEAIYLLGSQDVINSFSTILNERGEVARTSNGRFYQLSHLFFNHSLAPGDSISIESHAPLARSLSIDVQERGREIVQNGHDPSIRDSDFVNDGYQIEFRRKPATERSKNRIFVNSDGIGDLRSPSMFRQIEQDIQFVPTANLKIDDMAAIWIEFH